MSEAEKHLEAKGITEATGFHSYGYLYKSTLEAMELYATERVKADRQALRSAIEEIHAEHEDNQGPVDYAFASILSLLDSVNPSNNG